MTCKKRCYPAWSGEPGSCKHFGADPDGDYCGHPESLKITGFGLSTNAMSREGLCTHGEKGKYELWEAPDDKLDGK